MVSQTGEVRFLHDAGLCPKVEKEDKSNNAYICNKNTHYFVLVLIC